MPDSDLGITISADASGVWEGAREAKAAVAGLGSALSGIQSTFASFGAAAAKAFAPPDVSGVVKGAGQVKSAVDGAGKAFDGLADKAKDSLGGAGDALSGLGAASLSGAQGLAAADSGGTDGADAQVAAQNAAAGQIVASQTAANGQISASNDAATANFQAGKAQQVAAATSGDATITASGAKAAQEFTASQKKAFDQFKSALNTTVSSFTHGLLRMAEGTETFRKAMLSLGQQILNDMLRVVDGMIDKWALGVAENVLASTQGQALLNALGMKDLAQSMLIDAKKTASATAQATAAAAAKSAGVATEAASAQAEKALNAQVAFSGAIAAISPIPFIGPYIAPAMAAEMASLASAAGGFDIPAGVNPLTQLHQQEMVLPARLANPMRDMLANYGAGGGSMASGHTFNFGDFSVHGAPSGMSSSDFRQALNDHATHVAGAVAGALRNGYMPPYRQPTGRL